MIYRFRVILDAQEDIFRDIEIEQDATAEDFHNAITQAFGFGGQEMACFYISDEAWNQGNWRIARINEIFIFLQKRIFKIFENWQETQNRRKRRKQAPCALNE